MPKYKKIAFILAVVVMSFAVSYLAIAWTDAPSGTPPACPTGYAGCDRPINISSTAQTKSGALTITADLTATRLLDSSNPAYLVDPANSGYSGLFAGNVGIGTTNPGAKLNVDKGIAIGVGGGVSTTDGGKRSLQFLTDTSYGGIYDAHSGYLMYSTMPSGWGTAQLHFARSTEWKTYDSTPTLSLSGSNVGIGTTSPAAKLEVKGSILASGTGDVCNGEGKCLSSVFQTNVRFAANPTCPTEQTMIMKAYNGTWYTADNASITTWSQVVCGVKMCVDGSPFLFNQAHCAKECTDKGGTVVGDGSGNNMCRLNAEVCPSGWHLYNGWTTTYGSYSCMCKGTDCGVGCSDTALTASQNCGGPCATPCTGGHAWSDNSAVESVTCGRSGGQCTWCDCCCCTRSVVRAQIGCY